MKKTIQIITGVFLLAACGQKTEGTDSEKGNLDSADAQSTVAPNNAPGSNQTAAKIDDEDRQSFWTSVAEPILRKDKEKVMATKGYETGAIAFSYEDNIALFDALKKGEFDYDAFFNEDFLKSLSSLTYKDVSGYKFDNTTVYHLTLQKQRNDRVGTLELEYHKVGDVFSLRSIHNPGENFYLH